MNPSQETPEIPVEDAYALAEAVENNALKQRIADFARPFARILPDEEGEVKSTSSYVGGYPFMPAGRNLDFPHDKSDRPLIFLCQINFSELPEGIPDVPTSGLLQWFVEDDELYGLSFEEDATGQEGLVVRWFSEEDLEQGSSSTPYDSVPGPVKGEFDWDSPLLSVFPTAVKFRREVGIPSTEDYVDNMFKQDDAEALLDTYEGEEIYLMEALAVKYRYPEAVARGDKVGGYPALVQGDPRYRYPDKESSRLMVQLDSEFNTFTMWGDMGAAELYGIPDEVAKGDLSSVRWDWACH